MKVSLNWLKELVDYNLSPKDLADKLSLTSIGVKDVKGDYLELDLTYNRGDLLSMRGVAREVAAITGRQIKFTDGSKLHTGSGSSQLVVEVKNEKLCPVYCLAKIEGLKVDKSSDIWVKKLSDSGIRAVNNVADVTNLTMLEYGQPIHAFDARAVKDEAIVVRLARKRERITTLDGKTRDLDEDDLLIADHQNILGLAGVMGGKDSEVTDSTTTILLEAAIFDPISNRATSRRHRLFSEASKRFMHGLTKTNLLQALAAAIKMYEGIGGKLTALTLTGDLQDNSPTINLRMDYLEKLLGIKISASEAKSLLEKLNFKVERGENLKVTPPYYRLDISIEEDVIEEVARMYGYEKIPARALDKNLPQELDQSSYEFIEKLKGACKEAGLTEVSTYSFYSTEVLNNMEVDKNLLLKVSNRISTETEYLRFTLWENLLEVASKNVRKGHKDIAVFELGKTYHPKKADLPEESYELSILLVNGDSNPMQELCAILQKIMGKLGIKVGTSETKKDPVEQKLFHPKRVQFITVNGKPVGGLVEVHPRIVNRFGIEQRVAVAELSVEKLF